MAFTIEGKSGTEWLKEAKARQAKGKYDDTGAREAIQRMQGRSVPVYDKNGQRVGSTTYNYQPPAKKAEPAKPAPKPAPKPEARQTAAMPKPASHASPAKADSKPDLDTLIRSTQEQITKARAPEAPKKADPAKASRPAPGQAKGSEAEWTAKRTEAKGRSSLYRAQAEARKKAATYREPTKYTPKRGLADSQMGEFSKTVKETGRGIAKALNANDPDSWISDPLGIRRRRQTAAK